MPRLNFLALLLDNFFFLPGCENEEKKIRLGIFAEKSEGSVGLPETQIFFFLALF